VTAKYVWIIATVGLLLREDNNMRISKVIINENQRGFLYCKGRFSGLLTAGRYYTFGDRKIELADITQQVTSNSCDLNTLLANKAVAESTSVVEVGDNELALHFVNGRFSGILRRGRYAFWSIADKHEYQMVDITSPEVSEDVPEYIFAKLPTTVYTKVEVAEYQRASLYFNKRLVRILEPGTYYFWKNNIHVEVSYVDTRLTGMNITGQEIMTQDKVSLRINFVCNYRIKDYVKILTEIDDYEEQIHVAAQLALRDYVGKYKLDDILASKDEISRLVFERLKAREDELYVEITDAGIKDIILPGEIRDIMNTVLVAEKRAQANVITRREEVASTRSLLNTARLMEENKTLYKLKELEFVERICENVGNININGNGDVLSQLAGLLHRDEVSGNQGNAD
jgi:hypothetical protein